MKLLLDQGLPRSAALLLSQIGIHTVHVADIGLSAAEGQQILLETPKLDRIIVTP